MAQDLAIAKAALSASLFRADPTSLTRPAVDAFFPLLSSTMMECSRPNVQKCKAWIVDNVAPSRVRTSALGKYLVALSKSQTDAERKRPSCKRRRLHILYIVSDVAHHVVTRLRDAKFGEYWEAHLPLLVASASNFDNCPKHMRRLEILVDLWEERSYLSSTLIDRLRLALSKGISADVVSTAVEASDPSVKLSKDKPYVLPSFHGDSSTPWYDLPASTWLPHMTPNSTKPMMPDLIQPIQLAPGPADKQLVAAVQGLLADVERLYSKDRKMGDEPQTDLNELGERIVIDEVTGDIVGGETYYGWSRGFCEKMKERKRKAKNGVERGRSRSRSRSSDISQRSRSRSYTAPKGSRRRRGSSASSSPQRRDRSRSRNRDGSYGRRSYSRSPTRSRSRSPQRTRTSAAPHPSNFPGHPPLPPPPHQHPPTNHQPPPQAFAPFMPTGDFPPPPPPPPPTGYQGPWPPPPPPPPPQGWFPGNMPPNMMGGGGGGWNHVQPPPPPPHPPQQHQYQYPPQGNHYGRGNGSYRGRGGGGYNRGRGW